MSTDWEAELKKMKKETEEPKEKAREKENELRKKYEGDKEKILDLVHSQLKPVVETFRKEGLDEGDQPKIGKYQTAISLDLPIVEQGTHRGLSLTFSLTLSDNGYALVVKREGYDHVQDRNFYSEYQVPAPVTAEDIRGQIRQFIKERDFAIEMLEKKRVHFERKYSP